MLKRVAAIVVSLAAVGSVQAQDAEPEAAASPLSSRAVMTSDEVILILDETVDWYRMLGVQQQSAAQPSELLILYANRQAADRVVALVFEVARANTELLSSQAEIEQQALVDAPTAPQVLQRDQRDLDARKARIENEIEATQRQISGAAAEERTTLQAKVAELQSELDLINARGNLVNHMLGFAHETDANGSGISALREHIDAIAHSIPAAAADAMPELGADATPVDAAALPAEQVATRRVGIWDLGANVLRIQGKLATIDEVDGRTEALQQTFAQLRASPERQIEALSARGDALGARADDSDAAELRAARAEYDTIAWLFSQTSSILVPLTKASVLLDQYRSNLDSWRVDTRAQRVSALKTLATRVAILLVLLGAVFVAGEVWKRAVFGYVQEARRRHQLIFIRRIVMWTIAIAIIAIFFATEASSFATFAGLLTAGVAVAMQSVLVSMVGYFFLVGRYGLRVGDRVQIGTVTGEVIELGFVRLHLMELGPQYGPTGRVVAFANSVVFQASGGIFKQIPGVNLAWREMSLAIPDTVDYAATKERLAAAAEGVLDAYRDELDRQARELRKTSWGAGESSVQAQVQLRFSFGSTEAIVRYPVPVQRAAEVEERMSRALLDAIRDSAVAAADLATQPS